MEVRNGAALWLLMLVPVLAVFLLVAYRRSRRDLDRLAGAWRFGALSAVLLVKTFFSSLLIVLFFVFSVLALADPRWGEQLVEDDRSGYEVILAVDVSRSMLARDTPARDTPALDTPARDLSPTRLERTAEAIRSFLDVGGGFRYGVVLFRREAACVLPVTEDRHAVRVLVDHLSPALMTPAGTNLERGILRSLDSFETAGRFRTVILFTDGEDRSGDPLAAARQAGSRGIPIIPVAAGTEAGSMILLDDGSPVRDGQGRVVVSKLDRGVLEEIAQLSGGRVYEVEQLGRVHRDLPGLMKGLEAGETHRGLKLEKRTRYRLFLFLAVLMLMLSILIRSLRWRNTL